MVVLGDEVTLAVWVAVEGCDAVVVGIVVWDGVTLGRGVLVGRGVWLGSDEAVKVAVVEGVSVASRVGEVTTVAVAVGETRVGGK